MGGEDERTILLQSILDSQTELRREFKDHIRENARSHGKLYDEMGLLRTDMGVNKAKLAGLVSFLALCVSVLGTFLTRKMW